jgi:hypothetical protein
MRPARLLRGRITSSVALTLLGASMALPAVLGVAMGVGSQGTDSAPITTVPVDNPRLGLVYQGLAAANKGTPCVGAYQVAARDMCTHGPDGPPPGLDVRLDVAPVAASMPSPTLPRQDSAEVPADADILRDLGAASGDDPIGGAASNVAASVALDAPAAVPDSASTAVTGPHGVVCDGDGQTGKRVQVLYAYESDTASRYSQYLASFRNWAVAVDTLFVTSAAETGGTRHVRYVTTPDCAVEVDEVELPAGGLTDFSTTIDALRKLGYGRTDRKYLIFADSNVYCGIGTFTGDDRPGANNRNNGGPGYARTDAGCWNAGMATHELGHTLGAVNNSAPHSSKAGHCTDEYDLMCYDDSGSAPTKVTCPDRGRDQRLDCRHDDYFNTSPSPGSYLATHWNVADSEFLIRDYTSDGDTSDSPTNAAASTADPSTTPSTVAQPVSPSTSASPAPSASPTGAPPASGTAPPSGSDSSSPAPAPTSTGGLPPTVPASTLTPARVSDVTSNTARLRWPTAGPGIQYGIVVNSATTGWTPATGARLVGLRPDTTYTAQIFSGADSDSATAYTTQVSFRTAPAARPAAGDWFQLGNALTGGAAELYGTRGASGNPLVLQPRDDAVNQQWRLKSAGNGQYLLQARATGKCVAPRGGTASQGAPLVQQVCASGASSAAAGQRWQVTTTSYGYTFTAAGSGLVIGVGGQWYGDDRLLVLQRPTQARHQSWTAVPV